MRPSARLLDLTRLVSRLGQGHPTGVDRVESAYLAHFLTLPAPVFGLVRSKLGFILLNRQGMVAFQRLVTDQTNLPAAGLLSRLSRVGQPLLARAETAVRRLALTRCRPRNLPQMLRRHLPDGFTYFNTGHANLAPQTLVAIKAGGATQRLFLVHDTIPLDHPEFTRKDTIASFDKKLAAIAAHADAVIHTAHATRSATERHLARHGRTPPGLIAPLGINPLHPNATPPRPHPYFVTLGTIEPRKNHAFLLEIWQAMHRDLPAATIPHLLILGRRGWSNEAVFRRLDTLPFINQTVFEMPNLPDDAVANLLLHARALLFPSLIEGFGLPPIEAASLGTAVIVPPLPIYRETLGNYPVYAGLDDSYSWIQPIIRLSDGKNDREQAGLGARNAVEIPRWDAHFKSVLNFVG
ncbi:glycosyltransferase [Pseudorhodobacter ferrugineus]|uniref:glycosyltransferase n=1 Tax=Pseudorhodobacter ferrugineus TaxID=77008 RepID=UPI0003B721D4|nr:glycosyltransferase [Pseudorhodobacter ferrugineus]